MRKRVLCFIAVLVLILSVFTACSAKMDKSSSPSENVAAGYANDSGVFEGGADGDAAATEAKSEMEAPEMDANAITGSGTNEQSVINAVLAERKVIKNANVTIEVEKFDEAYSRLNSILLGIGFIERSDINTDKIYVKSEVKLVKSGVIVVRVDKNEFDKVFNNVKGLGVTTRESSGTEDVTSKYLDVESRLRLLRYEEGRLEEYLKKLDDPDKIFKTQSRLTDIRHEIESFTVTLRKLNDLVDLSTITINMNEKRPIDENPPAKKTYGERLLGNFLDSFKGVIVFCGELIIIVFQVLPILVVMGFFVFIAIIIYKKALKRNKKE